MYIVILKRPEKKEWQSTHGYNERETNVYVSRPSPRLFNEILFIFSCNLSFGKILFDLNFAYTLLDASKCKTSSTHAMMIIPCAYNDAKKIETKCKITKLFLMSCSNKIGFFSMLLLHLLHLTFIFFYHFHCECNLYKFVRNLAVHLNKHHTSVYNVTDYKCNFPFKYSSFHHFYYFCFETTATSEAQTADNFTIKIGLVKIICMDRVYLRL